MKTGLSFDHMFTPDQNHQFRSKLGKAGFFLENNDTVRHPGEAHCRFIAIQSKNPKKNQHYKYLEFIHIGKGGDRYDIPGFSFRSASGLESFHQALKKRTGLKSAFTHRNYEWKKDDVSRLPGWNFVNFEPKFTNQVFFWITEYEPRKRKSRKAKNPNAVTGAVALEMTLTRRQIQFLGSLLNQRPKDHFQLACGTKIFFKTGSRNRIDSVVLKTKSLKKLVLNFQYDELSVFQNQACVKIKNPNPAGWDVKIIE